MYYTIPISGFFGKGIKDKIIFFQNFLRAMIIFPKILYKERPDAIISSGGYTSLVPILWALILHIKFFILEQNRIPGRTTKYFSKWAKQVFLGFPLLIKIKARTIYTGNPLRAELINYNRKDDGKTVLVLGGSQGSSFINLNVVELAVQMPELNFIIQTGKYDYEKTKQLIKSKNCQLINFTLSMEKYYEKASVVISRAGGMVLSELLVFGIPSIIIPYPFATDNHQAANAQFLAQNNAAIILDQYRRSGYSQEFVTQLKVILESLISNRNKLNEMSKNALSLAKSNSAEIIAQYILNNTILSYSQFEYNWSEANTYPKSIDNNKYVR
jgi:UDP-N-acetylglucosamine--N-acetylmuramyl-(pentapeptide) pyrophosphoryl-undecaprenol N-acetylglucosamine transferase